MSVINIVNAVDEIHMFTDGASWNDDDKITSFNSKVGILPHLNMSVSLMGSKWLQKHLIGAIGGTYSSFDDVVRTILPFVQREYITHEAKILEKCYPHFLLVFCGWSDWAEGCEAYALSNMDLTRPLYCIDAPAWTLIKLGSHSFFPHQEAVVERLSASPSASHEEMGVKIVDVQRSIKGLTPDGRRQGSAGGFVQHTTVRKDGITTKVIKRYPDVVGAPAAPDDDARCGIVVSDNGATWLAAPNSIDNAKLADMATARIKGRVSAGTGDPEDLTPSQALSVLGATAAGTALLTAPNSASQRSSLGATSAGEAIFTASSAAAQRTALGASTVGSALFTAASASAQRTALGASVAGSAIFTSATTAGQSLASAADAAAQRMMISAPPLPQTASGAGQVVNLAPGAAAAVVLPAGGTWMWGVFSFATSGTNIAQGWSSGVDAGGTTVRSASGTQTHTGFAWRIA